MEKNITAIMSTDEKSLPLRVNSRPLTVSQKAPGNSTARAFAPGCIALYYFASLRSPRPLHLKKNPQQYAEDLSLLTNHGYCDNKSREGLNKLNNNHGNSFQFWGLITFHDDKNFGGFLRSNMLCSVQRSVISIPKNNLRGWKASGYNRKLFLTEFKTIYQSFRLLFELSVGLLVSPNHKMMALTAV